MLYNLSCFNSNILYIHELEFENCLTTKQIATTMKQGDEIVHNIFL